MLDSNHAFLTHHRTDHRIVADQGPGMRDRGLGGQLTGADVEHDQRFPSRRPCGRQLGMPSVCGRPRRRRRWPGCARRRAGRYDVFGADHGLVSGGDRKAQPEPLADALGLAIEVDERLAEYDYGHSGIRSGRTDEP